VNINVSPGRRQARSRKTERTTASTRLLPGLEGFGQSLPIAVVWIAAGERFPEGFGEIFKESQRSETHGVFFNAGRLYSTLESQEARH
jgi:hypothetical protein